MIVGERLIDALDAGQTGFVPEPAERRCDNASTICCTQYGNGERHGRMGGGAHAESILDRIVHNATRIEMGDVNMRERMAQRRRESEADPGKQGAFAFMQMSANINENASVHNGANTGVFACK